MSSPQRVITDTNKGPLIQVLTLMLLVIAILSCIVRTGTKLHVFNGLSVDDYLTVLSTVFATVQSAIIFYSADHGLGKVLDSVSPSDGQIFFKAQYAGNAFFILSVLCSKLAGTFGIRMLSRNDHKWVIWSCEAVVGAWGISSIFASLFQCKVPTPWDYSDRSECIDLRAFWLYYSLANIVTDLAIIAITAENVRRINTSWSKKLLLIAVFGCRILIVPAAAAQLYFSRQTFASDDFTFRGWENTIAMQLVQCLAIFTVCAPILKPFLDSLESGQIRIDDLRRQGKPSSGGYPTNRGPYPYGSGARSGQVNSGLRSKQSRAHDTTDVLATAASGRGHVHEMTDLSHLGNETTTKISAKDGKKRSWDGQSSKSQGSQTILIQQTWQVDVQKALHQER